MHIAKYAMALEVRPFPFENGLIQFKPPHAEGTRMNRILAVPIIIQVRDVLLHVPL